MSTTVRVRRDAPDVTSQDLDRVFTPEALTFLGELHERFEPARQALLAARLQRQDRFDAGELPGFLAATEEVRKATWQVAEAPADLLDRRVEITGPVTRKMMINALNSGANVFLSDMEDALSPTWKNVVEGQINVQDAVRRTISFIDEARGRTYALEERTATMVIRPRGWHLSDKNVTVNGQPLSASLLDFGLHFFHNAKELLARGSGPYFYLPKLEAHTEARLWNEVFVFAQAYVGIPRGTVRATVLIETLPAAFEMDEILFELREHASGLNAGRWDYIFSLIKTFRQRADKTLPDRAQVTMAVPFMRAYAELLVRTCHRRGAHAIGGMAAFIPSRRDEDVNRTALAKVHEDKAREVGQGFDGTWVAHPDLVPVARGVFDGVLGTAPHQKQVLREDARPEAQALLDTTVPNGSITEAGVRNNIAVALRYLEAWFGGDGAAAIFNLMEDVATAEISRAQLWQWIHHAAQTKDGRRVDAEFYRRLRDEELHALQAERGEDQEGRLGQARVVLDELVLNEAFVPFLTELAYPRLP